MNPLRERELSIKHEMQTCCHFTGLHHDVCAAGVAYQSVRDHRKGYRMARWPCLTIDGNAAQTICGKKKCPTREEAERLVDRHAAAIATMLANLEAGICNTCGAEIESETQVGLCVYAKPCGHRIGQGKARNL